MSFPRYGRYKNSGVEWLDDVPEHWEIIPIKYLVKLCSGGTPSKTNPDYWDGTVPWASAKDLKSESLADTEDHITQHAIDDGAAALVAVDSLLIVVRGMILVHTFPVVKTRAPMAINQDLKAVLPTAKLDVDFLAWLLRGSAQETDRRIDEAAHGTKVLRMEAWTSMCLPVPPRAEQTLIAAFLDRETAKIDVLVEEQRRLIELLKEKRQAVISHAVTKGLNPHTQMMTSGPAWLGDIPAHWRLPPLYMRYDQVLGKMLDHGRMTGEHPMPYLRNQDVRWDYINREDLPTMDIAPHERERFTVRKGDLLMVEGRELGRSAIWEGDNDVVAFQKALHRLRPLDTSEHPRFFYYMMAFANTTGVFFANQAPNEIPHLTGEELRKYRFPKPPYNEQAEIVEFLDRTTRALDALVIEVERAIDLLQERRTALISAAVTGKIDVRGLAETEAA